MQCVNHNFFGVVCSTYMSNVISIIENIFDKNRFFMNYDQVIIVLSLTWLISYSSVIIFRENLYTKRTTYVDLSQLHLNTS